MRRKISDEHPVKSENASWMDDPDPPTQNETPEWIGEPLIGSTHSVSRRRGWLKNGNRPGDPSIAPRCGAKNRRGLPCQCAAMKNGRCRLHGGLSTGPKTDEGRERIRKAVTKHGRYSARAKALRRRYTFVFSR
jgi:hypothetical protein